MRRAIKRHKVTFVGLGLMGLRHARAFATLDQRFELAGTYDLRSDAPASPHAPKLRTEEEAVVRADVVVVATPAGTHAGVAARALAAGRHVFVEKPLCATAAEASALVALSGRGGPRLFVGHSERFNPVIRVLARLIRGEPVLAIDFRRVGPSRPSDCGVLVHLGVHDFDLAAYLGEGPLTFRGALGGDGEDLAHVLFATAGGGAGHLCVDRSSPIKHRSVSLTTPDWFYEGDLLSCRLVRTARTVRTAEMGRMDAVPADVPLPIDQPLVAQASALADALDGRGTREIATGEDGAHAVAIAEHAAAQCARSLGRPQTVSGG